MGAGSDGVERDSLPHARTPRLEGERRERSARSTELAEDEGSGKESATRRCLSGEEFLGFGGSRS